MKATTVDVRLGGEDWTLRFDAGAIEDYEKATTTRLDDGTLVRGSIANGIPVSFWELSRFIWACIKAHCERGDDGRPSGRRPPTKEQVRDGLMEEGAMERLYGDLQTLISDNVPEEDEEDGEDADQEGLDGVPDPPTTGEDGSDGPTPSPSSNSD